MKVYPISEEFFSIQGEGLHLGRSAYFLRLFGCALRCQWCDTKYAWQGEPAYWKSAAELVDSAVKSGADILIVTGGEPCLHDLLPILKCAKEAKIPVHLETSASLPIIEDGSFAFDWVSASPKLFSKVDFSAIERADEIKLVLSSQDDLREYEPLLEKALNAKAIWLHPEWSRSSDGKLLDFICESVKRRGGLYRAGWQIHKNYFVR